jgi:hypothetical protein
MYYFFLRPRASESKSEQQEAKHHHVLRQKNEKPTTVVVVKKLDTQEKKHTLGCIYVGMSAGDVSQVLECDENEYKVYLILGGGLLAALLIVGVLYRLFCFWRTERE